MKIGKADFSIWGEEDVLIWQYCNAPNLAQIIENEFAFYKKNVTISLTIGITMFSIFLRQIPLG